MMDGPSVLGFNEWRAIERKTGVQSLVEGLQYAVDKGDVDVPSVEVMAALLSGALNEGIMTLFAGDNDQATMDSVL